MADLQALIDSGMSPEDAALLVADLQRYETVGVPNLNLGVAPETTIRDGVQYQNLYGGMDIIPGMTSSVLDRIGIENPQVPVYTLMESQAQNNPNDARRMSFMPTPGRAYRLVDNQTGEVVMTASTPEEYASLAQAANAISGELGRNANFQIQSQDPESLGGGWTQMYADTPDGSFGDFADILGDAALGLLAGGPLGAMLAAGASGAGVNVSDIAYPVIGAMTPLGPIAGAAAGSAASGAIQGRSLKDIITRAGITAATAGLMKGTPIGKSISKGIGGALSDIGFSPMVDDVFRAVSEGIIPQAVGDEIIVNAITDQIGSGVASGVVGSGIGSGLGSVATPPTAINPPPSVDQIPETIVTGQRPVDVVSGIGGSVIADGAVKPTAENPFPENTLVEAGQEPPPVTAGIGGVTGGGTDPVTGEQNEIIVTKDGEVIGLTPPIIPDVGPFDVSTDITNTVKDVQVPPDPNKGMTAADYVKLALNAANVLGAIGGAGGDGATLGPDNSAISYIPLNRQQRTRTPSGAGLGAYGFDPFTYGQASGNQPGEYLFFEPGVVAAPVTPAVTVPSGALQFAEGGDVDDDMVRHLIEYRKGGGHNGPGKVKGIGSGQEDKIPAWLSDGEYVWSAQDVADLGDGSTDEGVRRLDKMRQMVRHRAGRKDVKKIAKPQKGIDSLLAAVGGK